MAVKTLAVHLSEMEYRALSRIARRRKKTVPTLMKDAAWKMYFKRARVSARKMPDLIKSPAFGIWKDDPRTDGEMLNDLGRIWNALDSSRNS